MRVIVQGVIGGVDIKAPDMQTLLLKRANFLGYKPKSKKNKKDFGYCIFINLVNFGILFPKMFYLKFDNTFYSKTLCPVFIIQSARKEAEHLNIF